MVDIGCQSCRRVQKAAACPVVHSRQLTTKCHCHVCCRSNDSTSLVPECQHLPPQTTWNFLVIVSTQSSQQDNLKDIHREDSTYNIDVAVECITLQRWFGGKLSSHCRHHQRFSQRDLWGPSLTCGDGLCGTGPNLNYLLKQAHVEIWWMHEKDWADEGFQTKDTGIWKEM